MSNSESSTSSEQDIIQTSIVRKLLVDHIENKLANALEDAQQDCVVAIAEREKLIADPIGGRNEVIEVDQVKPLPNTERIRLLTIPHMIKIYQSIREQGFMADAYLVVVREVENEPNRYEIIDGNHRLTILQQLKRSMIAQLPDHEFAKHVPVPVRIFPPDTSLESLRAKGISLNKANVAAASFGTSDFIDAYYDFVTQRNYGPDEVLSRGRIGTETKSLLQEKFKIAFTANAITIYLALFRFLYKNDPKQVVWKQLRNIISNFPLATLVKEVRQSNFGSPGKAITWITCVCLNPNMSTREKKALQNHITSADSALFQRQLQRYLADSKYNANVFKKRQTQGNIIL